MTQIELSFIVTCYFEEQSIDEFASRLLKTARSLGRSFEVVMVNDGSTDGTFDKLKVLFERDAEVTTIIDLYRNAGQVAAMTAGITHALVARSYSSTVICSSTPRSSRPFWPSSIEATTS